MTSSPETEKKVSALLARIRDESFPEKDERLLRTALSSVPSQSELDGLLQCWDIEAEGGKKALLLSYFMKMHPELTFPSYVSPRLAGLLNYYHFQNIRLIAQFQKICDALNRSGIDFIVLKGGAMKCLRPGFSRIMNDIDVLVREADFGKAEKICRKLGYDCRRDRHALSLHARSNNREAVMDIHRFIDLKIGNGKVLNRDFFERARQIRTFGVDGRIPSREDMLFITLVNLVKNLMDRTSSDGLLFAFFDVQFLTGAPGFDWGIVLRNAEKTGCRASLLFIARLLGRIVPGLLPEALFEKGVTDKEMDTFCTLMTYRRFLLCPLQSRSHTLGIRTIFARPALLPDFLKVRPRYTALKLFRTRPAVAKIILAQHGTV